MKNLTVNEEKVKEEKKEVRDELNIIDEVRYLIDNSAVQNSEVKGDLYFINIKDLKDLPENIVEIVDNKLGD